MSLDLLSRASVHHAMREGWDAVVHLAAISSGSEALRDPVAAWRINALGTAILANELGELRRRGDDPLVLLSSTSEVYGAGSTAPRVETDPAEARSPYAASKLAGEIALLEVHRRTGLRAVIARTCPHTGPGQDNRFVVPAFAERLLTAKRLGAPVVKVGNLEPVREYTHVADVVAAYMLLIEHGRAGELYNVSSGRPITVRDLFFMLADAVGHRTIPEVDPELVRPVEIPYLVGDSTKLRSETGWEPNLTLEQTIQEVVDAQTN